MCPSPSTPTYLSKVGHISVLQCEKGPLFADFHVIKHPFLCKNADLLAPKLAPFFFKTMTFSL